MLDNKDTSNCKLRGVIFCLRLIKDSIGRSKKVIIKEKKRTESSRYIGTREIIMLPISESGSYNHDPIRAI